MKLFYVVHSWPRSEKMDDRKLLTTYTEKSNFHKNSQINIHCNVVHLFLELS